MSSSKRASGDAQHSLDDLATKLTALRGATGGPRRGGGGGEPQSLSAARNMFVGVMGMLQGADVAPTAAMIQSTQVRQYAPGLYQTSGEHECPLIQGSYAGTQTNLYAGSRNRE